VSSLRASSHLVGFLGCFAAATYVLGRFVVTGEVLVRGGDWVSFSDRPVGGSISLFAFTVVLVGSGLAAYLHVTGAKSEDSAFRALDRRRLLDAAQRQDREGRTIEP